MRAHSQSTWGQTMHRGPLTPSCVISCSISSLSVSLLPACVYACACLCERVCFSQQMSHPVLKNHRIPSHHPLRSCGGTRLPALSSQSSRLLAVECWEYPERKGKWHHSGDLPCWATLPASRGQRAREPRGETTGALGHKTVIRMCLLEERREEGSRCAVRVNEEQTERAKIPGMRTNPEAVWVFGLELFSTEMENSLCR